MPPSSACPLFQACGYKKAVKTNILFSRFIDQIFNVEQRLRVCSPLEIY